mmetsp:Transcript_52148/g.137995  ORF Transcript_52148/g.137995 Transcript_52148/m.137995 type:complete len:220 (+) Transcript_52148:2995-3654(+)
MMPYSQLRSNFVTYPIHMKGNFSSCEVNWKQCNLLTCICKETMHFSRPHSIKNVRKQMRCAPSFRNRSQPQTKLGTKWMTLSISTRRTSSVTPRLLYRQRFWLTASKCEFAPVLKSWRNQAVLPNDLIGAAVFDVRPPFFLLVAPPFPVSIHIEYRIGLWFLPLPDFWPLSRWWRLVLCRLRTRAVHGVHWTQADDVVGLSVCWPLTNGREAPLWQKVL